MYKCYMCPKKCVSWPKMYEHIVTMHHPSLKPLEGSTMMVPAAERIDKRKYGSAKTATEVAKSLHRRGIRGGIKPVSLGSRNKRWIEKTRKRHRRSRPKSKFVVSECEEGEESDNNWVDWRTQSDVEEDEVSESDESSEPMKYKSREIIYTSTEDEEDDYVQIAKRDEEARHPAAKRGMIKKAPRQMSSKKTPAKLGSDYSKRKVEQQTTAKRSDNKRQQDLTRRDEHLKHVDEFISRKVAATKRQLGAGDAATTSAAGKTIDRQEQPPVLQQQGSSKAIVDEDNDDDIIAEQQKPDGRYCPKSMPGLKYLRSSFKMGKDCDIVRHSFFYAFVYGRLRLQNSKISTKCKVTNLVKQMFKVAYPNENFAQFPGVPLNEEELRRLDELFKLRLIVYVNQDPAGRKKKSFYVRYWYTDEEGDENFKNLDYVSPSISLYWYRGRYSFVTNEDRFNNFFECDRCGAAYWHVQGLYRHKKHFHDPQREEARRLARESKQRRVKGCYKPYLYLGQRLEAAGVPSYLLSNIQFPFFALYDIESLLDDKHQLMEDVIGGDNFVLDQEHVPMAVGVVCNFKTIKNGRATMFTAEKTSGNDNTQESYRIVTMIQNFIEHLLQLSQQAAKLYLHRNQSLMKYLRRRFRAAPTRENGLLIKTVTNFSKQLPVLGYNSSRYDLSVLLYFGFFSMLHYFDGPLKQVIKKSGFQLVVTQNLRIMDVIKFLAPGFTLRKFIRAFAPQVEVGKLWFPYEYVSSLDKLADRRFPSYEVFYSKLKRCNLLEEERLQYDQLIESGLTESEAKKMLKIDEVPKLGSENYAYLKNMWVDKGLRNMGDFLRTYLNHDLVPFLPAVQSMLNYYQSKGLDAFKAHSTLPSTALPMLFASIPENQRAPFLHLDREHHQLVRNSVQGGLAVIGTRWINCIKNDPRGYPQSRIKSDKYGVEALPAKTIVGYDFNALYGGCLGTIDHYAGYYCIRNKSEGYLPKWVYEDETIKSGASTWLRYEETLILGKIQSAYNIGEKQIFLNETTYKLDGYHRDTNTIYEYLGCYWHSHMDNCSFGTLDGDAPHPTIRGLTHAQNYAKTMDRIEDFVDAGYRVSYVWECQWKTQLNQHPQVLCFILSSIHPTFGDLVELEGDVGASGDRYKRFQEPEMLGLIKQGQLFGICVCDIIVPVNMRAEYSEFPPIFVKVDNFTRTDLPEALRRYAEENKLNPPKEFLTTKMAGQQCVLPSETVQFYLQKGFEVSNLSKFIQYAPGHRLFEQFLNDRVEERRHGGSVISNMAKLLQNAAVGFTLMREDKLGKSTICGAKKFKQILTHKRVTNYEGLGPMVDLVDAYPDNESLAADLYIVNQPPSDDADSRLPMVIGYKVLAIAKLHMLKFFDILQTYLRDETFEFLYSDTDSVYLALSEESLSECVKPELVDEWRNTVEDKFFVTGRGNDNSTPLLMKKEAVGTKFCALCPKMYVLCNEKDDIIKSASKGLPMKDNSEILTFRRFTAGIFEQLPPEKGTVTGIRNLPDKDGVYTYNLKKQALNIIYAKRVVGRDAVHTYPLDYIPPYADV